MIDWLTLRCPLDCLLDGARLAVCTHGDRIQRICSKTGEIRFETSAWDSVRSDSHQIAVRVAGDLWIQGSPARLIGDGDAVFSSGASANQDVVGCAQRMIAFVSHYFSCELPPHESWIVSRIDVTKNLKLGSLVEVRDALAIMRETSGGRYRASIPAGDTAYWSKGSTVRSAKAYAKGPHLKHLGKKKDYTGRVYTAEEVANANKILRLELTLRRKFFKENVWHELSSEALDREWEKFFGQMIGDLKVKNDSELFEKVIEVAPTPGQGKSAYALWTLIKNEGWERARSLTTERTWYRNLKILKAAGLGDADISCGRVVQLRKKIITFREVHSWSELCA